MTAGKCKCSVIWNHRALASSYGISKFLASKCQGKWNTEQNFVYNMMTPLSSIDFIRRFNFSAFWISMCITKMFPFDLTHFKFNGSCTTLNSQVSITRRLPAAIRCGANHRIKMEAWKFPYTSRKPMHTLPKLLPKGSCRLSCNTYLAITHHFINIFTTQDQRIAG